MHLEFLGSARGFTVRWSSYPVLYCPSPALFVGTNRCGRYCVVLLSSEAHGGRFYDLEFLGPWRRGALDGGRGSPPALRLCCLCVTFASPPPTNHRRGTAIEHQSSSGDAAGTDCVFRRGPPCPYAIQVFIATLAVLYSPVWLQLSAGYTVRDSCSGRLLWGLKAVLRASPPGLAAVGVLYGVPVMFCATFWVGAVIAPLYILQLRERYVTRGKNVHQFFPVTYHVTSRHTYASGAGRLVCQQVCSGRDPLRGSRWIADSGRIAPRPSRIVGLDHFHGIEPPSGGGSASTGTRSPPPSSREASLWPAVICGGRGGVAS